jgi:YHS domain-containing protein
MRFICASLTVSLVFLAPPRISAADKIAKKSPKEALQVFNDLIGFWNGTGTPEGSRQEKQRGFWTESMTWEWQFKKGDAWLKVAFEKGKHFTGGELRYLPEKDIYRFKVRTTDKESWTFEGPFKDKILTLERRNEQMKEAQRLVVTLLHANRFLYRFETKPEGRPLFTKRYEVGATKEGVAFAGPSDTTPPCIVSGGKGRITLEYKGKTYYFCCSGCRDAFKDDPEKYLKEAEVKKEKEKAKTDEKNHERN